MPRTPRSYAPAASTVAAVCLSLLLGVVAIWVMRTFGDDAWMGLALLGAGFMTLGNIPSTRILTSGLDQPAQGRELVAATNSALAWVPTGIGFVLLSAAFGAKVAGAAGGFIVATLVAVIVGAFGLLSTRHKRRLLAHPDATGFGTRFWVDLVAFLCFIVCWVAFAFYALFGPVGAALAALVAGSVASLTVLSFARGYRAWQANQRRS